MAYNPKTYDLSAHPSIHSVWRDTLEYLDYNLDQAIYIPIGTREEAKKYMFRLHRWRAAARIQMSDGNQWDHLLVTLVELEGDVPWGLKITEARLSDPAVKLLDAKGRDIRAPLELHRSE